MARTAAKSGKGARAQKKNGARKQAVKAQVPTRAAAATKKLASSAGAKSTSVRTPPAAPVPPGDAGKRPPVAARARPISVLPLEAPPPAAAPPVTAISAPLLGALQLTVGDEPIKTSVTIETARAIVETGDASAIAEHAADLLSGKPTALATGARVLEEVLARKPEMLVPQIERLVAVVGSPQRRAVQTAAMALPVMARLAPARVARHLPVLTERFGTTSDVAKDGLVATFAALCTASVAYQKRLEPVLELALSTADAAILQKWAETILPSLKGEPHARARAVVEARLPNIPRAQAQPIATFLGIKLRPAQNAVR